MLEFCDCKDCLESETPCHFDCDAGENECRGCLESRHDQEDINFDIDVAQGRK